VSYNIGSMPRRAATKFTGVFDPSVAGASSFSATSCYDKERKRSNYSVTYIDEFGCAIKIGSRKQVNVYVDDDEMLRHESHIDAFLLAAFTTTLLEKIAAKTDKYSAILIHR
jgi:hypothetical protein